MSRLYVFDLDGTLADLNHRLHHIVHPLDPRLAHPPEYAEKYKDWKKDWPAFFDACDKDAPIWWTIGLARLIKKDPDNVLIILSGRMDHVRTKTIMWLSKHEVPYDLLLMRKEGDYRDDTVVKLEMLNNFMRDTDFDLQFIVEDRQKVVDMWRRSGFPVLQCAAWDEVPGTYEAK